MTPLNVRVLSVDPSAELLLQEGFDDANLASRGWYDLASPIVANGELEHRWTQGGQTIVGGGIRYAFPATETLYIRWVERFQSGFQGSGDPFDPHKVFVLTDLDSLFVGPANNRLTAYAEYFVSGGGVRAMMQSQDSANITSAFGAVPPANDLTGTTEDRDVSGCNGLGDGSAPDGFSCFAGPANLRFWQAAAPAFALDTDPHVFEAYWQMNSVAGGVGQADGISRMWIDDVLQVDRTDVVFRTGARAAQAWRHIILSGFIGSGSPIAQSSFIDEITLATGVLS